MELGKLQTTGKHKGFGFVQFIEDEDAEAAIDNMNENELFGRTLRVNLARESNSKARPESTKPVWADDFFYRKKMAEEGMEVKM